MEAKHAYSKVTMSALAFKRSLQRWSSGLRSLQGAICSKACVFSANLRSGLRREAGQGTTEYAILVGVIVVIAILAITVFRPKLQELWDAIANGINSL